jgi:hypothetical protein
MDCNSMKLCQFKYCSLVAILALSGCDTLVTQDELHRPAVVDSLTFPADVYYTFQGDSPIGERYYVGLRAGRYVAEWEDARGTYYRGPDYAVVWADAPQQHAHYVAQGGLFVAKGDAQPHYVMYRYLGTEGTQARVGVPGEPPMPPSTAASTPPGGVTPSGNNVTIYGPRVTPLQAGVGAGIGAAIVNATKDMDKGKIAFQKPTTPAGTFEGKFVRP